MGGMMGMETEQDGAEPLQVCIGLGPCVNDAIKTLLNAFARHKGIYVTGVSVEWLDVSTSGDKREQLIKSIGSTAHTVY